jgi:anaerobic magnesium-protoporphyrin IX monomethyl ester cyclase
MKQRSVTSVDTGRKVRSFHGHTRRSWACPARRAHLPQATTLSAILATGGAVILLAHSYFMRHDTKQEARCTPYSPLSTLIAAAMLRDQSHTVALFDATFAKGIQDFERVLDRHSGALLAIMEDNFNFLTKMCTEQRRSASFAMIAAARRRGSRVLVNGPDSSDRPQLYLQAGADAVLLGEGEAALIDIAAVLSATPLAPHDDIAGIGLPDEVTGMRRTAMRPSQRNLDKLPLPAWDLVDVETYRKAWTNRHNRFSWNVATSRGCPYACNWCAKPIFGRGYEQRSAAMVARELRSLKDHINPDHIWFSDDIFGLTTEWLQDFAWELARLDARTPFMMQSRVNLMKPEAVAALAEAGAEEVWLGVESGSQKILDAMEKGSRVAEARVATRLLKAAGIRACWFIQLGYPGETWEDISLTRNLILEEQPHDIGVSVAYPLPGTRFYDLVKAGLGERHNWRDSDDLAMLFEGTYGSSFYRLVRDHLHDEVRNGFRDDCIWARLGHDEGAHRSTNPILLATGS